MQKKLEKKINGKLLIGRNEWTSLPDLSVPAIKAKIDTGAKTSSLHAVNIKKIKRSGRVYVKYDVYPIQNNDEVIVSCQSRVIDERFIMSSNGHKEHRCVISTTLCLGDQMWPIEISLADRDALRYKMLLGREALSQCTLIDPGASCCQGRVSKNMLRALYNF